MSRTVSWAVGFGPLPTLVAGAVASVTEESTAISSWLRAARDDLGWWLFCRQHFAEQVEVGFGVEIGRCLHAGLARPLLPNEFIPGEHRRIAAHSPASVSPRSESARNSKSMLVGCRRRRGRSARIVVRGMRLPAIGVAGHESPQGASRGESAVIGPT